MAVTETCRARIRSLLTGPSLPLTIELNLARQVRTGETRLTQPPTGFATVQDYVDCLALLEREADAAGLSLPPVEPMVVGTLGEPRTPLTPQAEVQQSLADAAVDPRALSLDPFETSRPTQDIQQALPAGADSMAISLRRSPSNLSSLSLFGGANTFAPTGGGTGFLGDLSTRVLDFGEEFLRRRLGGGTTTTSIAPVNCPEGFEFDIDTQTCRVAGLGGVIQRTLPGGQTGIMNQGQAVTGMMGMPAVFPAVVGTIQRTNGITGPILRCPTGLVLGKDDLCYAKSVVGRRFRKWPRAPRPPVTAGDAKAIRKAAAATKRVKKLAGNVGFTCVKKGSRRPR